MPKFVLAFFSRMRYDKAGTVLFYPIRFFARAPSRKKGAVYAASLLFCDPLL